MLAATSRAKIHVAQSVTRRQCGTRYRPHRIQPPCNLMRYDLDLLPEHTRYAPIVPFTS